MIGPRSVIRVNNFVQTASAIAFAAIVSLWLVFAMLANRDAAPGRFALFMDELVTYDGVVAIHKAKSPKELVAAVVGPDQRYGRPTWYVPALFSAPFAAIGGETTRIFVVRMVFALALLGGLLFFCMALIDTWPWRAAAIATAAVTPYAAYYATMPKPEPFLLLFTGIFVLLMRRGNNLGMSWIFLGLAFGLKLSLAPALPLFFVLALTRAWGSGKNKILKNSALSLVAFLAGWIIAVPILVTPGGFETYLSYTWKNTGHLGSDDRTVTPVSWLKLIADDGFFGAGLLSWMSLGIIVALELCGTFLILHKVTRIASPGNLREAARDPLLFGLSAIGIGLILVATIAIGVNRLWGFYLFPGAVLILFGAFAVVERLAARLPAAASVSISALGAILFLAAFTAGSKSTVGTFLQLAKRSVQPSYALQQAQYNEITTAAQSLSSRLGRSVNVLVHASFFSPTTTPKVQYSPLFGQRDIWVENFELVFLDKDVDPKKVTNIMDDYSKSLIDFYAQREDHLAAAPEKPCKIRPCYVALPTRTEGLYGWARADIAATALSELGKP